MTRIAVVSGGLREPSTTRLLADRIAAAVQADLTRAGDQPELSVIEPRTLGHPVIDAMVTGFVAPELDSAFRAVTAADGLIAVTPVSNASFGGLFKSFFDVLPKEAVAGLPVLVAATGGTARHSLLLDHALRPMFSYLHAVVSPTGVYAATEDFGAGDDGGITERIDRAAGDFARLVSMSPPRVARDAGAEELELMARLLGTVT